MGGLLKLMEVRGRGPLSRVCCSDVHLCFLLGKSLSQILPFGGYQQRFTTTVSVCLSLLVQDLSHVERQSLVMMSKSWPNSLVGRGGIGANSGSCPCPLGIVLRLR